MPLLNQVYRDPILSDISIRYRNTKFIGEQVFPTLPVDKATNYVFTFDQTNLRKPVSTYRTGYARANRIDYGLTQVPIPALREASLEIGVTDDVKDMYQAPLQPMINATNTVAEQLLIEKEAAVIAALTSAQITQTTIYTSTNQWNNYLSGGTSNPLLDVQSASTSILTASLQTPNTMVMGRQVYDALLNHPQILDRIKYTNVATPGQVRQLLADFFQVEQVLVGESVVNTAGAGLAASLSLLWGKHAWLMYINTAPAIESITAGYTLYIPEKRYVDTWYEQERKTTIIRNNDYYTQYVMGAGCIYWFQNVVA